MSKPSNPFLVGQIVRQQNVRCPFLVISGGNECYHNPLPHSFLLYPACCSLSMNEAPLQSDVKVLDCFSFQLSICTLLAPLPLYVFYCTLFAFCFDWPFQSLLLQPPISMACLVVLLWSGTLYG